ncbi:MAG: hypothetical protein MJB57_03280, partial [Gemmatimonadetes bacterium]|nr:hypothetical protein [Gemmatimonadota bacterium]
MRRRAWVIPFLLVAASCPGITSETTSFSASIERLSGPGGYFDTDNLISNERSYLHAISDLRDAGVQGGAYLGVGPDQNFSYIAEIRPELAVIVDIRPDNVLQHLIYKALFHTSQNRLEYLARLTGRPLPPDAADWSSASIDTILAYLDRAPVTEASRAEAMAAVEREIEGFGVRLTDAQRATIERFHG